MREQFARVLGLTKETIVVRHLPGAGCYGHNGADDVAMDAALLARGSGSSGPRAVEPSRRIARRALGFAHEGQYFGLNTRRKN
jgi:hypothetical protein